MPLWLASMPLSKITVWPWTFWCPFWIFPFVLYYKECAVENSGLALKITKFKACWMYISWKCLHGNSFHRFHLPGRGALDQLSEQLASTKTPRRKSSTPSKKSPSQKKTTPSRTPVSRQRQTTSRTAARRKTATKGESLNASMPPSW